MRNIAIASYHLHIDDAEDAFRYDDKSPLTAELSPLRLPQSRGRGYNTVGVLVLALLTVLIVAIVVFPQPEPSQLPPSWLPPPFIAPSAYTHVVTVVQLNDVYEPQRIPQVATVVNELRRRGDNVLVLFGGDTLTPSPLSAVTVDGRRIDGAHMIAALNALRVDYAVLGNHDLIDADALRRRIAESTFVWLTTNADADALANANVRRFDVIQQNGRRVLLVGVTMSVYQPYVRISDLNESVFAVRDLIAQHSADIVIAVTHQTIADDKAFAEALPTLAIVVGGHEHSNSLIRVANVAIAKADSDAASIFIHSVSHSYDAAPSTFVQSHLVRIDERIQADSAVQLIVDKWLDVARSTLLSSGIDMSGVVLQIDGAIDARQTTLRSKRSLIGQLVCAALLSTAQRYAADAAAVLHVGALRSDELWSGNVTVYDVLRLCSYGDHIAVVNMSGTTLRRLISDGLQQRGTGEYVVECGYVDGPTNRNVTVAVLDHALTHNRIIRNSTTHVVDGAADQYGLAAVKYLQSVTHVIGDV